MAGLVYGGRFEQIMNEFCSPQNIAAAASKFKELEREYGTYTFGKFAKHLLPNPEEFANWERDAGGITAPIRHRLTEVISTNLKSGSPLPMVLKVSENVDSTHDLHVRAFAHNGHIYIGLLMLCPNTSLS
ncbi:MAG TPA: hypothetical protein VKB08_05630 [Bradyrhizobium sp.]|nr:hypothetical protein [Bradyrhizobium sp.]